MENFFMQLHLYNHTKPEAIRLSERALSNLGFRIQFSDRVTGHIQSVKKLTRNSSQICFDIRVSGANHGVMLLLVVNIFSGKTGTFTADQVTGALFMEMIHDLLIREPANPFRLTSADYALASAF